MNDRPRQVTATQTTVYVVDAAEIRAELARQDITQDDLAHRVGMSPSALSRRLAGLQPFELQELEGIAAALGVPAKRYLREPKS